MGYLKYVSKLWEKPKQNFGAENWRNFLVKLREESMVTRLEHPTRPDRARALGYKAKQGIFVARVRVTRGGSKRPKPRHGRKPSNYGRFITRIKSDKWIAEERAGRDYRNCEVINSYWVAQDGRYKWFEVILIDRELGSKYSDYAWVAAPANRGRVFRGLTSAGRHARLKPDHNAAEKQKTKLRH